MLQQGQLQPEDYIAIIGVYTEDALQRKLRDIKGTEYLLLPSSPVSGTARDACAEYLISLKEWFMYPARLPCVANALDPGASIFNLIESNYLPVEKIGSWLVMRRISNARATAEGSEIDQVMAE